MILSFINETGNVSNVEASTTAAAVVTTFLLLLLLLLTPSLIVEEVLSCVDERVLIIEEVGLA